MLCWAYETDHKDRIWLISVGWQKGITLLVMEEILMPAFFFFFKKTLFSFNFWLLWVFIVACGIYLVAVSRCVGFSLQRHLTLWSPDSRVRCLSSCSTLAFLPHGMQNLLRPGIKPMSPALASGFLTTGPPGSVLACSID